MVNAENPRSLNAKIRGLSAHYECFCRWRSELAAGLLDWRMAEAGDGRQAGKAGKGFISSETSICQRITKFVGDCARKRRRRLPGHPSSKSPRYELSPNADDDSHAPRWRKPPRPSSAALLEAQKRMCRRLSRGRFRRRYKSQYRRERW